MNDPPTPLPPDDPPPATPPTAKATTEAAAPPTAQTTPPTARRIAPPRPFESLAGTALKIGIAGLILPGVAVIAIVVGIIAWRRVQARTDRPAGLPHAITSVALGVVGLFINALIAFGVYSVLTITSQIPKWEASFGFTALHSAADSWSRMNNGQYPDHIAQLAVDDTILRFFDITPALVDSDPATPLFVGTFDLTTATGGDSDVAALQTALETLDLSSPTYSLGKWTFVRLAAPTQDPRIIFGWRINADATGFAVISDDGAIHFNMDQSLWDQRWREDAAARVRLNLPPLPAPPYPLP